MTVESPRTPADDAQGDQPVVEPSPPRDVGWKDFLKAIGIIWAVEIVLGILTAFIMLAASGFQPNAMTPRMEYLLPTLVLSWFATLCVVWYFACRKYRHSIRTAFAVRAIPWKTALRCVAFGAVAAVMAGFLMYFFANGKGYIIDLALQNPEEEGGEPSLSPLFLVMMILVPPFEEIYYRGIRVPVPAASDRGSGGVWHHRALVWTDSYAATLR